MYKSERKSTENTYCFYHDKDFDGILSAAIVLREYPDAKLMPYDYGYKLDLTKIKPNSNIFIVDCCLPEYAMKYLDEFNTIYLFDHHARTCTKEYKDRYKGTCEIGTAACMLVYEYFYPLKAFPHGVQYIAEFDMYNMYDYTKWVDFTLPFQYGMKQFPMDPKAEIYQQVIDSKTEILCQIIAEGKVIMRYNANQAEVELKKFGYEKEIEFGGKKLNALIMNRQMISLEYFISRVDKKKHDLVIFYCESDGKYHYSLRSWKGGEEVYPIAKHYMGGGRKYAAGFVSDKKVF